MVTAVLIYNMDIPDDVEKHKCALKADMLQLQIDTFYDKCFRTKMKHMDLSEATRGVVEEILEDLREHFRECYSDN